MTRHLNPLLCKYEFESSHSYLANRFLKVLYLFHINLIHFIILVLFLSPDFFDISQIEFRTTQKKRIQMTYVFKRLTDAKEGEDYEIT